MALQRPFRSTEPLERKSLKYYSSKFSGDGNAPWTVLASGTVETRDEIDWRPTYLNGVVINVPPSAKFRRSTSYTRERWEVGASASATFVGATFYSGNSGYNWYDIVDGGRDSQVFLAGPPVLSDKAPNDMKNEATAKALLKLADQTADMGENLATFSQTCKLFTGKTSILVEALKLGKNKKAWRKYLNLTARDLRRNGTVIENAASAYIQYVYGLRPLMQDVYNLWEAARKEAGLPLYYTARGKSQRTNYKARVPLATSYSYVERRNWESNQSANTRLTARIDPEWGFLRSFNQLGLLNPAKLAWDLVPFSFIIDWVIPIGTVLGSYAAPAGLIFVDGYFACRTSEKHSIYYGLVPEGSVAEQKGKHKPSLYPVTYEGYYREAFTSWPRPGLWIDRDPLRGDRIFKATALTILALK